MQTSVGFTETRGIAPAMLWGMPFLTATIVIIKKKKKEETSHEVSDVFLRAGPLPNVVLVAVY
jgi:hypothetical protein